MNKKKLFKGFAGFCAGLMMFTPAAYLVHAEADDKTRDQPTGNGFYIVKPGGREH